MREISLIVSTGTLVRIRYDKVLLPFPAICCCFCCYLSLADSAILFAAMRPPDAQLMPGLYTTPQFTILRYTDQLELLPLNRTSPLPGSQTKRLQDPPCDPPSSDLDSNYARSSSDGAARFDTREDERVVSRSRKFPRAEPSGIIRNLDPPHSLPWIRNY
jgi:hypothetical protein